MKPANDPMKRHAFGLTVDDGVRGLSRVVGALALLELTPSSLIVRPTLGRLEVYLELVADDRDAALCAARLERMPCVARLQQEEGLSPVASVGR
jgi:acetolactate synthase small subunit